MTTDEMANRIVALELAMQQQMTTMQSLVMITDVASGQQKSTVATIQDLESWVKQQVADPPMTKHAIGDLVDAKLQTAQSFANQKSNTGFSKPILESKAVQDIGALSDAKTYRRWNMRMKNAIEQTRPLARKVLDVVEKMTEEEIDEEGKLNQHASYCDAIAAVYQNKYEASNPGLHSALDECNRDLWSLLVAKAEGEAVSKMKACNQGDGLWAYKRLHKWFTRTTAQGKSVRRSAILNPTRCAHEHEISAAIEEWEERYRILQEEDRTLDLPDEWKMTALQSILCGEIKKQVEYREVEFKSYDELRSMVMKWAVNKRIEKDRSKNDPMDTDQIDGMQSWWPVDEVQPWQPGGMQSDCGWWPQQQQQQQQQQPESKDEINYLGKGQPYDNSKGKGKGHYNPLQMMMTAMRKGMEAMKGGWNQDGKGKGGYGKSGGAMQPKGGKKGGGKGACFNCGQMGHIARNCPNPPKMKSDVRGVDEEPSDEIQWTISHVEMVDGIADGNSNHCAEPEDICEVKGLEPTWRKKIVGGNRIQFVLDSGAVKTIIPKNAIPGAKLKSTGGGKSFRVANGKVIPNLGSTVVGGKIARNGNQVKFTAQVADVTKPLASVDEMVGAGNLVVLHKDGGVAKKLSKEAETRIAAIIRGEGGPEIALQRKGGTFVFDIDVESSGDCEADYQKPKKTVKPRNCNQKMDVDYCNQTKYSAFWEEDADEELMCVPCDANQCFHRR